MLDGSGLRLQGRLLGHADLHEAQRLVPAWLPLPDAVRAAVPAIWTRLLGHPGFNADVIEDLNRPAGQRIVGLGVAIALDARWAQRLREDPPPFAPALLYAELMDGRFQPPGKQGQSAALTPLESGPRPRLQARALAAARTSCDRSSAITRISSPSTMTPTLSMPTSDTRFPGARTRQLWLSCAKRSSLQALPAASAPASACTACQLPRSDQPIDTGTTATRASFSITA